MNRFIPYGRQTISDADIVAVSDVLRADFLTTGPKVEEFERHLADRTGAKHAVVVSNATAALHLALRAAQIGTGHRVVTSPNTFLASANCAAFVGAIPDFSDIDPVSYNLDPNQLAGQWRPDTKAVVAVDYAGQPANLPEIARIARERGAVVIEDACHSIGGSFTHAGHTWKIGGHPWADITVFSFHSVKTMTTGEGGAALTNNEAFASTMRRLRAHGVFPRITTKISIKPFDSCTQRKRAAPTQSSSRPTRLTRSRSTPTRQSFVMERTPCGRTAFSTNSTKKPTRHGSGSPN